MKLPSNSALKNIFSLELFLILFLFAGRFKADPRFASVPIDLTLLFMGLTYMAATYVVFLKKGAKISTAAVPLLCIYFLLVLWMSATLLWSPSMSYGPTKVLLMTLVIGGTLFSTVAVIAPDPVRLKRLYTVFLVFGYWTVFETVIAISRSGIRGFENSFGGDYITLSSTLSIVFIISFIRLISDNNGSRLRSIFDIFIILIICILMLSSGARGPLLALILTLALYMGLVFFRTQSWKGGNRTGLRILFILFGLQALVTVLPLWVEIDAFTTFQRFQTILYQRNGGSSVSTRLTLVQAAYDIWTAHPVAGAGAGSFGILAEFGDVRAYPHNIFLEFMSEFGLVGLILFLSMLAYTAVKARRAGASDVNVTIAVCILISSLISAMISGDITDNRIIFLAIGLICGASRLVPAARSGHTSLYQANFGKQTFTNDRPLT